MKNYWRYILLAFTVIILILAVYLFVNSGKKSNLLNEESMNVKEEIKLIINDKELIVELENNIATKELLNRLKKNTIKIKASDYGNFEKVGELGFELPTSDELITTKPGDIILYQGNKICLYYAENTWRFTKLGHIKDISEDELIKILGKKDITYKLSRKGD